MVPINSTVTNMQDLLDLPIRTGAGPTVSLRDIGTVADSSDMLTGYALVNGRRAVYIPVTKRADASTLDVVNTVKANLRAVSGRSFRTTSRSATNSISHAMSPTRCGRLIREGALGALLTGLMVLLFLRDWRSAVIVVVDDSVRAPDVPWSRCGRRARRSTS